VLPWKGAVREPSNWKEPSNLGEAPENSLSLSFVYGYRGWDCRNNLEFVTSSYRMAYHVAAVGIIYNSQDNTQVHNLDHDDDILCLAVHPAGSSVATGEIGPKPKIVIWDANTGVTIRTILFHTKGVSHIAFSGSGSLLVSIGIYYN
jgi:microtubule-associated protein-like 6